MFVLPPNKDSIAPNLKYDHALSDLVYREMKKRYEDGYTYREIGAYYGISASAVHLHLKRLGVVSRRRSARSKFGFVRASAQGAGSR